MGRAGHLQEREIFTRYLRERGGRVTAERLRVFDEIFDQHGHVDADKLFRSMRRRGVKISRATVYRNLELLVDCGLVRRQRLGQRRYLYEHVHPGQGHDHLVCGVCGRVVEFVSPAISALQREIARAHDFDPEEHTLQISGVCVACATVAGAESERSAASGSRASRGLALVLALMLALGSVPRTSVAAEEAESPSQDQAAEPAEQVARAEPSQVFDSLVVTGGAERVESVPGSATFISTEQLRKHEHSDVQRILREVPGVNIQEEEGYGLRPNIGMRGTGVERSQKITLLEDGVLIAPAPYAAPAAYYFPTAGRMSSVEVRKGSAAIAQGPYTNGGVINLVSSSIPDTLGGRANFGYGTDQTWRAQADAGDSRERWGWLLETYRMQSDGFKDLDGGGSTGFDLEDYLGKFRFGTRGDAKVFQAAEIKLGRTEQLGDETYLGLTRGDFVRTPFRRYAGSQEDYLDTEHEQAQLRYFVQPTSGLRMTATLYRNDFFRNWHKLQSVNGQGLASVLDTPELFPAEIGILRGEIDDSEGALSIRNNRRNYLSEGFDLNAELDLRSGSADHSLRFGLRMHEDEEDRFQEEDLWNMVGGRMQFLRLGTPGSQSNRVSSADATALFVRDDIRIGRWSLSPGLRFENIDFSRSDFGKADPGRTGAELSVKENGTNEWLPGLGVGYQLSGTWALFGGAHKGFAPPGPGQSDEVENEESINYELGFNYRDGQLGARVVGFRSDYDNLLGRDTLSVGGEGTGDAFNGGEVEVQGLEALLDYDFGRAAGSASVPVRLVYTYTSAEFGSSFETSFADWSPEVERGDELPYIPEHQLTASAGYQAGRWATFLSLSYTAETRTRPGQGAIEPGTEIDERLLADLSFDFYLRDELKLFAQVRNLTDETYLVARRPAGTRPGLPQSVLVGINWNFGR